MVTHPSSDHLIATRPGIELTTFWSDLLPLCHQTIFATLVVRRSWYNIGHRPLHSIQLFSCCCLCLSVAALETCCLLFFIHIFPAVLCSASSCTALHAVSVDCFALLSALSPVVAVLVNYTLCRVSTTRCLVPNIAHSWTLVRDELSRPLKEQRRVSVAHWHSAR